MNVEPILETLSKQTDFVQRAAAFPGRPRERIIAMSEAADQYFRLYPQYYRALQTIRVASQLGQQPSQRDDLRPCESRLMTLLVAVIHDATRTGDLELAGGHTPGELAFTLWALAFGTRALMGTAVASRQLGIRDGLRTARGTTDTLLDAIGWQPLSTEWNYTCVRDAIRAQLLAEERRKPITV